MTEPRAWTCPVCGGHEKVDRYAVTESGTEGGVDAEAFRPSSQRFGLAVSKVVRCQACGHGSLASLPSERAMAEAYTDAADPVSLREEAGQVETARRALERIQRIVPVGRACDLGCWTGSFLAAARESGWATVGIEPSAWASARARERGLDVRTRTIDAHGLDSGTFRLVVMCDVLEHLVDPKSAVDTVADLLEPNGAFYLTVPDAGSLLARAMGRRWWSVLPMHVQYFTRTTLQRLLEDHGFSVTSVRTHAKVFTARYYAERLGGYTATMQRAATSLVERTGWADRLVAPDFRDRMEVIAVRSA